MATAVNKEFIHGGNVPPDIDADGGNKKSGRKKVDALFLTAIAKLANMLPGQGKRNFLALGLAGALVLAPGCTTEEAIRANPDGTPSDLVGAVESKTDSAPTVNDTETTTENTTAQGNSGDASASIETADNPIGMRKGPNVPDYVFEEAKHIGTYNALVKIKSEGRLEDGSVWVMFDPNAGAKGGYYIKWGVKVNGKTEYIDGWPFLYVE